MATRKPTRTTKATKKKPAKKAAPRKTARNDNLTTKTAASVPAFVTAIDDEAQRKDFATVLKMMQKASGERPAMWGTSIVGFGKYHYRYDSGREGDFFLAGASPRKGNLTLYLVPGLTQFGALLQQLGKHKTGKGCLYIKRLADVDLGTLEKLIAASIADMRRRYPS